MSISAKQSRKDTPLSAKRIVVTGGAGFLGGVVIRKLYERGCRMIVAPPCTRYDLSRPEDVAGLLDRVQPEVLLHLAATTDHPRDHGDSLQSFCNNVLMTTQVLDAACRRGVHKTICLGSISSYPAEAPLPLREEDLFNGPPEPAQFAYGIAKRLPLIQAQLCRRQYGFRCAFLIPTNFYGPGDHFYSHGHFIPSLIRRFVEATESQAKEIVLEGDGRSTHDFLHVEDCAEGVLLAVERDSGVEAINLGAGEEVCLADLASRIARLAGYSGNIVWGGRACGAPSRRVLDISRARQELGFSPRIRLEEGLRETIEWYRVSRAQHQSNSSRQQALIPHMISRKAAVEENHEW